MGCSFHVLLKATRVFSCLVWLYVYEKSHAGFPSRASTPVAAPVTPLCAGGAEAQGRKHKALALNPSSATPYLAVLAHHLIFWDSVSLTVKWENSTFLERVGRPKMMCAPSTSMTIIKWEKCLLQLIHSFMRVCAQSCPTLCAPWTVAC